MRSLPGMASFNGDFVAPPAQRRRDIEGIVGQWRRMQAGARRRTDPALLFNADGSIRLDAINRLLSEQNRRPIRLNE
jgi:hypothetical protein